MREESNVRLFQPEHPKNPYIGTALLCYLIIMSLYGLIKIICSDMNFNKAVIYYIMLPFCILCFTYLITLTFLLSEYIILTEDTVIGKNRWKKKKGEIRYDEIAAIYVKGKSYFIRLRDFKGKELIKINPPDDGTAPMLNEIIGKATNCKRIDLKFIMPKFPDISVYERGLQSE